VRTRLLVVAAVLVVLLATDASAQPNGGTPVALVTAEAKNELFAVSLPPRHVLARVRVPSDPQNVAVIDASASSLSAREATLSRS
jgi:hypothetical protein